MQIVVRLQVEGFHRWLDASGPVEFLANRHRHIFHIECRKKVATADREIEIITFKRALLDWLRERFGDPMELESRSCEMLATEIATAYGLCWCCVLEDGENGAVYVH